jgi:hypothetical protein
MCTSQAMEIEGNLETRPTQLSQDSRGVQT